ncbi:Cyclic pyranopterin monophosphate synthase accessory protein [Rubripirellula obstinata]|uniref:cyclic pyranopterin monophosphate synthase n=2 Tax=Rubripirellula obstinata TaxID=406547 RepID=A0A5B1CIP5_9BACT|nr:Cyclic pyranopterin monophosphate synthase accessory protein [Rubripirellula obstinata]
MVDVSAKTPTVRVAVASGEVTMLAQTADSIRQGSAKKGDVLTVARLAAIAGAKWTSHLIPLCHAIPIEAVSIEFDWKSGDADSDFQTLVCRATVTTSAKTGVEMEAMTAVSVAALTVYDMVKSIDRAIEIGPVRLEEKSGGKSGHFVRQTS